MGLLAAWAARSASVGAGGGNDPFGTEIGGDDVGVAADLGRVAIGDQPALVQHGNAVGQGQDTVNVVLDEQHGVGVGQFANQRANHLTVGLGQAREGFVEQ